MVPRSTPPSRMSSNCSPCLFTSHWIIRPSVEIDTRISSFCNFRLTQRTCPTGSPCFPRIVRVFPRCFLPHFCVYVNNKNAAVMKANCQRVWVCRREVHSSNATIGHGRPGRVAGFFKGSGRSTLSVVRDSRFHRVQLQEYGCSSLLHEMGETFCPDAALLTKSNKCSTPTPCQVDDNTVMMTSQEEKKCATFSELSPNTRTPL